ncbi:DUF5947 family protein [Arthrobacter bambusae]|uniref:DUF5947 family protein n=1 Tax=Arthrobacter bambusae TaxID=1338426 RepID=UPI0027846004|nr:DUF5947 family protein [Arthrobacter bambusae]MDQ0213142.1 hypothetical protein [Arthrobacter bambusae]MDQ0237408.1 hypothetical protein [Arthrobacter bambusae]
MAGTSANGLPVALLRKIATVRPAPVVGERCEMCGEPIPDEHQHVVDIESHAMMCTCRPCYLLFTDSTAHLRYRSVPDRYLSFPDFELGPGQWDELEIPVGLAFFFRSSKLDRTVAFYPGPAGATESELPLDPWDAVLARNPALSAAAPDTEALLIRGPGADRPQADCHLVPVDACYELVGHLRRVWRGFDGGQEAREQLAGFFERVSRRSKPLRESNRGQDAGRVPVPGGQQ